MNNVTLYCGAASVDVTPAPGLSLAGQMHDRVAQRVHDPLRANAVAFRQGRETVVIVSADVLFLDDALVRRVQQTFARRTGLAGRRLLLHATHTHDAPATFDLFRAKADPRFGRRLEAAILTVAQRAVARLAPIELFAGTGQLEHLGWNRRAMFADGTSRMYGDATQPGFVGMEGPRDGALPVLFARNRRGQIPVVLVNFATHPNCIESECYYSADLVGAVRATLQPVLGRDTVIVYLTGAAGNTAPSQLDPFDPHRRWRGEAGWKRSDQYVAGEVLKVIAAATEPVNRPVLKLAQTTLRVPVRRWPRPTEPSYPLPLGWPAWPEGQAYYARCQREWPARPGLAEVRLSVVRIGDVVLATNPAELFVEFGLEIKRQSPARVTVISELTDGYCGYVPTRKAFGRGGHRAGDWPTAVEGWAIKNVMGRPVFGAH